MKFGDMLRNERVKKGFRQSTLAEAITTAGAAAHQSSVSEWEREERRPTLPQWKALVQVMEWTPDEVEQALELVTYEMGGAP